MEWSQPLVNPIGDAAFGRGGRRVQMESEPVRNIDRPIHPISVSQC